MEFCISSEVSSISFCSASRSASGAVVSKAVRSARSNWPMIASFSEISLCVCYANLSTFYYITIILFCRSDLFVLNCHSRSSPIVKRFKRTAVKKLVHGDISDPQCFASLIYRHHICILFEHDVIVSLFVLLTRYGRCQIHFVSDYSAFVKRRFDFKTAELYERCNTVVYLSECI